MYKFYWWSDSKVKKDFAPLYQGTRDDGSDHISPIFGPFSIIHRLANGDVTKYEQIEDMMLIGNMNILMYLHQMDKATEARLKAIEARKKNKT